MSAKKASVRRTKRATAKVLKLVALLAKRPGGMEALERAFERLAGLVVRAIEKDLAR